MTTNQIAIIGGVAAYMVAMLAVGYWASRRVKDARDYIVAGGRLGWGLSIGTIFATWFGAETCMGSSGKAFDEGILGVISDPFGAGLCLVISGLFFAHYFRRLRIETIVDYFELRYGPRVAGLLSILYVPVYLGWIGGQLLAFGAILESLTGLDSNVSMLIATGVVVLYTYWGGMWADTMTDFLQMFILVAGLLILFPILVADLGGWSALVANAPAEKFRLLPSESTPLSWLNYLEAWMIVGLGSLPAQDLFQRIMAARNATISRWSSIIAGLMYVTFGMLPILLGIFGAEVLPDCESDRILIELSLKYLSAPLVALMVGALLSAIMSSADSAILAPAGIIGHNIVPKIVPGASEATQLKWCKWSVPILTFASLALALWYERIYELCLETWGVLLVGVAAPMIFGVYWRRATAAGALAAAVAGTGAWIAGRVLLPEGHPTNLYGFAVSCAVLVTVSLATPRPSLEALAAREESAAA